jgi:hypothetical protein
LLPGVRDLFQLSVLHTHDLVVAFCVGFGSVLWFEAYKLIMRRRHRPAV